MDCNSYSYAPHMLDETPAPKRQTVNAITIERKEHNGHEYFTIKDPDGEWFTKVYTLKDALKTVKDYMTNGI